MPNAILQISAGDLCDFAHRLIESATDVARLQIERANLSKELLTIEEVADMLKVSKMTLYRWNLNDTLPKIEIEANAAIVVPMLKLLSNNEKRRSNGRENNN